MPQFKPSVANSKGKGRLWMKQPPGKRVPRFIWCKWDELTENDRFFWLENRVTSSTLSIAEKTKKKGKLYQSHGSENPLAIEPSQMKTAIYRFTIQNYLPKWHNFNIFKCQHWEHISLHSHYTCRQVQCIANMTCIYILQKEEKWKTSWFCALAQVSFHFMDFMDPAPSITFIHEEDVPDHYRDLHRANTCSNMLLLFVYPGD